MKREQLIELRRLGFSIDFIMKATGIKAAKINNMFYKGSTKFSEDEADVSDRFYNDAVNFMAEWDLNYFVVTYLICNNPKKLVKNLNFKAFSTLNRNEKGEFKTKAMGKFEATQNFKEWAKGLDSRVRVIMVEKLEL